MYNKINLLYFSTTGNSKKVVETIGKELGEIKIVYDLTLKPNRQNQIQFGSDDLVVCGVPVYGGRLS